MAKQLIAVCQLTSKNDKETNFENASNIVKDAADLGCKMVFLPECVDFIANHRAEAIENAETLDGPLVSRYRQLAKHLKTWISLGGIHQKTLLDGTDKILNAHVVIGDDGEIKSVYHKVHLFNLEIPNVVRLVESETYESGTRLVPPVETPIGRVGLGICYDVRFPEIAIAYTKAGASALTYPSSFTVPTGTYHWETLLRARAIENQCYVIAAAQTGQHNAKRSSFGHAMVVDPWGSKIAQCSEGPGFAVALIDADFLRSSRAKLPIWTDRRYDLYADINPAAESYAIDDPEMQYMFSDQVIPSSQVFYRTRYSYAFLNHRPVLPGHVLVSPLRVCEKYTDLTHAEIADLMQLVQRVERVIERKYDTDSTTITIQDGIQAGQSVFHVHVHLLPRKPTDFGGNIDQIYRELKMHDKQTVKSKYRKWTPDEMSELSRTLRKEMEI